MDEDDRRRLAQIVTETGQLSSGYFHSVLHFSITGFQFLYLGLDLLKLWSVGLHYFDY